MLHFLLLLFDRILLNIILILYVSIHIMLETIVIPQIDILPIQSPSW